jgi:hypothetical protein
MDGLTVDVASNGTTVTTSSFKNNGTGANTKARLDFFAASTRYAGISGGYGASAAELSFDISGTDVLDITSTGIDVTGTISSGAITSTDAVTAISYNGPANSSTVIKGYNGTSLVTGVDGAGYYYGSDGGSYGIVIQGGHPTCKSVKIGSVNAGITVIDASRNLTNIGTISSGTISLQDSLTLKHTGVSANSSTTDVNEIKWGSYGRLQHTSYLNTPLITFNAQLSTSDFVGYSGSASGGGSASLNRFVPDYSAGGFVILQGDGGGNFFISTGPWNNNTSLDNIDAAANSSYRRMSIQQDGDVIFGESGGKVGIGTNIPASALHVHSTVEEVIRVDSGNTGAIHFFENTARRGIIGYSNGTSITTSADAGDMVLRAESGKKIHLSIGGASNANLNSSGQFLINFLSPASTSNFLLGVDGGIGLNGDDLIAAGAGYGPSNNQSGAGTIKLYDTGTGNMNFNQTYTHARYYFYHGGNEVFRIEDGGFSGVYGYSFYHTTQHGSVGVGALNSGYHHTMVASGPTTFYWSNRCEASGGFHTYSDERLKENITTISGALDKVALMNGVTFNWIDAENRGSGDTGKQFGVIAQNMLTVDPELPSLNSDPLATQEEIDNEELETDYYTMDYSRITPFLIESIKELKTKLEAAEARITELEG